MVKVKERAEALASEINQRLSAGVDESVGGFRIPRSVIAAHTGGNAPAGQPAHRAETRPRSGWFRTRVWELGRCLRCS